MSYATSKIYNIRAVSTGGGGGSSNNTTEQVVGFSGSVYVLGAPATSLIGVFKNGNLLTNSVDYGIAADFITITFTEAFANDTLVINFNF